MDQPTSQDWILGYATNASAAAVEPFMRSARRWHPSPGCRIVLFVSANGAQAVDVHALAQRYAVDLIPATSQWAGQRPLRTKIAARGALAWWRLWAPADSAAALALGAWLHPHYTRWLDYHRFLQAHPRAGKVFLSDVTDVIFQANVFERIDPHRLTIAELPLAFDGRNIDSAWMRDAAGPQRLRALMGRTVLCIGTVGGPWRRVAELCQTLWQTMCDRPFRGVEQAIFNDLYYRGALGSCVLRANDGDFVLTTTSPEDCPGLALRPDGLGLGARTPAVVHMFNRLPPLWQRALGVGLG